MTMDHVKAHFDSEAREFDRIILTLIPHYETMVRTLIEVIPFAPSTPLRIIDLGCGTGTVAAKALERFPNADVTCVDLSENMISMVRSRFGDHPNVHCIVSEFSTLDFPSRYDVAISSLALHHLLTDEDKREFYRRIYEHLTPGGVFYNADVVLAANGFLQELSMKEWRRFMSRNVSPEEIEGKWIPTYENEDRPARLRDQLGWLEEIGFVDVDVVWKYFNFAVYGGVRPH